jgi:hypothetical protein
MKRFILTCFTLAFSFLSFTQQEYTLFELHNDDNYPAIGGLNGEHSVLNLNTETWEEILDSHPANITIEIPFEDENLRIQLHEVNFFKPNLIVRTASGDSIPIHKLSKSVYYNGTFEGYPNSHFALSVLNEEVIGVGNIPGIGDLNLGLIKDREEYVFFPETSVTGKNGFECLTADEDLEHIEKNPGNDDDPPTRDFGDCVGLYFEVDHDIYLDKGLIGATDYITAMFNEIYLLYDADAMTVFLADILVWDEVSPYDGVADTPTLLNLFGTVTPVWTGDLGHFVSYRGNGGLAWLDVFCHPDQALRKAVSDIDATFEEIPVFSWTIEVVAHEMGHNFGSPHTHACFWNGDMTAIDGCGPTAGYDEGCTAPLPTSGTIMSYCHLVGGVGIDLGLGFGVQPGDHIRDQVIAADCLESCDLNPFMDVEVALIELTSSTCFGDSIFSEATITNNGNDTLFNVDIEMYVDAVLETTISWSGELLEDSSEVITLPGLLLPIGTHTINVRSLNPNGEEDEVTGNNEYEITFEVTEYAEISLVEAIDASCFGTTDGSIDISVTGGTPSYTFEWDNDAGAMEDPVDLPANIYTLTLTDDNGCIVEFVHEITQPAEIIVEASVTVNPDCYTDATGEAEVVASGGAPGYSYLWSSGGTGTTETGLTSGEYTITVTDDNGCTSSDTINVESAPELIVDSVLVEAACGVEDGAVNLTVSGGTPGYIFEWSTGDDTEDLIDVLGGTYDLTITDANDCVVDLSFSVPEDEAPELILEGITHIDCFGDAAGEIIVSGTHLDGAPEYEWSIGDSGPNLTGVTAGEYTVTLSDESNCTDVATYTIIENPEILIDPEITEISCYGDEDGEVIVAVSGGVPGYEYLWSTGEVTAGIDDLAPGSYTINITDELGCEQSLEITFTEPDTIAIDAFFENEYCGGENGSIDLSVAGGTPGYSYTWSTGATTSSLSDLGAGIYNVVITDENGCFGTWGIVLEDIDNFDTDISFTDALCYGEGSGTGTVEILSGTSPYTYLWSDGQTTPTATELEAGLYSVLVSDANACEEEMSILIDEPNEIEVASSVSNEVFGGDGEILVTVIGGTPPYSYSWNTGATTEDLTDLEGGTYTLTITDANGCVVEYSFVVGSQLSIEDFGQELLVVYPNPANDFISISNKSDMEITTIRLYNSAGQLIIDQEAISFSNPQVDVSYLANGMYYLVIRVDGDWAKSKILIQH